MHYRCIDERTDTGGRGQLHHRHALAECLADAGAEVLGPCSTVGGALGLLQDAGRVDVAVLDVRLEHETSGPVGALAPAMGAIGLLPCTGVLKIV